MTTNVKFKDRNKQVNFLRMALNMVGLGVTYEVADLIEDTVNIVREKQGKMDLEDVVKLQSLWEKRWDDYHREQSEITNVNLSE